MKLINLSNFFLLLKSRKDTSQLIDLLASSGDDCTIRIWNWASDKIEHVLVGEHGHSSYVSTLCYISDLDLLASGSGEGIVKIWDYRHAICLNTITDHVGSLLSIIYIKHP